MALVGKIEEMRPAEILIFLAESWKTGKLKLTTGTQEGMIVFREGKIIYAASSSIRETFGSIALALQIVTREQLDEALGLQYRSQEDKRLGEILVEIGAMTPADVQKILTHQVGRVVNEIFEWEAGYFKFRNLEIEEFGDVEVDARDLIAGSPLDTRSVALDAARVQDEASQKIGPAEPAVEDDGEDASEETTMAEIMIDVAAPALTAEIIREIMETAETVCSRGVIFAIHEHSARGLAQFGLDDDDVPASHRVREQWLSLDDYSVLARVVGDREIFRGEPDHIRGNQRLVRLLGGYWPQNGVAIPVTIGDRVGLVFYGDNQPEDKPVGSTTQLEQCLVSVGRRLQEAITK